MTTWVNSQFPRPDFHRQVQRHYGLQNQVDPNLRGLVVCAWGAHGSYMDQDETVFGWIESMCKPHALGLTREGHPRHPLYVPFKVELVPFTGRKRIIS